MIEFVKFWETVIEPMYLGDSVYIKKSCGSELLIYVENGGGPKNIIYLDSMVTINLYRQLKLLAEGK
jgi:hypothetical protein